MWLFCAMLSSNAGDARYPINSLGTTKAAVVIGEEVLVQCAMQCGDRDNYAFTCMKVNGVQKSVMLMCRRYLFPLLFLFFSWHFSAYK